VNGIPLHVNGGMILIRIQSEQGVHVCARFNRLAVRPVEDYSNEQHSFRFHKRQGSSLLSDSILNVQELCTLALVLLCLFSENTDNVKIMLFSVNVVFNHTALIRVEERL
jgi:hypothetical protein